MDKQAYEEKLAELARKSGYSFAELSEVIERFAEAAQQIVLVFSEMMSPAADALRNMANKMEEIDFEELDREWKRDLHKLNFKRPRIQHQVFDRKPRNLVKKII